MRTIPIVALVLSLSFAFALIGGSGVGAEIFGQSGEADPGFEEFMDNTSEEADPGEGEGEGLAGDVGGDDEATVVGFVFSGATFIFNFVGAVALFPVALINLGFPEWFALPVGGIMQIVALVGAIQFITGREWL